MLHSNLFVYLLKWRSPFIFITCYKQPRLQLRKKRWKIEYFHSHTLFYIAWSFCQLQGELFETIMCFRENEKEIKETGSFFFFVTYLTCNQLLRCKGDRFVYWLIQRDDEHNNRTIDLLYSTVYLWVVMCYVEMIKRQTSGFISTLHFFKFSDTKIVSCKKEGIAN